MKIKEKSCGCIIIDKNKVLLVQQKKGRWGFPKGHVEKDETEKETALREVKEETNLDVEIIGDKKYSETYITRKGNLKEVVYFVAKIIGGEIKPQKKEINKIEWVHLVEAKNKINYDTTKKLYMQFLNEEILNN